MSPLTRLAQLVIADPKAALEAAERIVAQAQAKRTRVLAKSKPRRDKEKAESLNDVARRVDLRVRAMKRAQGVCELCNATIQAGSHLHHLEMGSAKAKNERLSSVMIVHPACHLGFHMNPGAFTNRVSDWCARHGYPLPNRKEYR